MRLVHALFLGVGVHWCRPSRRGPRSLLIRSLPARLLRVGLVVAGLVGPLDVVGVGNGGLSLGSRSSLRTCFC